jgi:hypothetical protein
MPVERTQLLKEVVLTEEIVAEGDVVEEVEAIPEVPEVPQEVTETPSAEEVPFFVEDDDGETDGLILAERSKADGAKHF